MSAPTIMPRREWEKLLASTINQHVIELRFLVAKEEISGEDHDRIGLLMQRNIAEFISLSDEGWATLQRLVTESRRVQAIPHEPDPEDHQ